MSTRVLVISIMAKWICESHEYIYTLNVHDFSLDSFLLIFPSTKHTHKLFSKETKVVI